MILPLFDSYGNLSMVNVPEEILYLQTDGCGGLYFYSENYEYSAAKLVGEWESLLSNEGFLRIDRGTIVNMQKVSRFDPLLGILEMKTSSKRMTVPVATPLIRRVISKMNEDR